VLGLFSTRQRQHLLSGEERPLGSYGCRVGKEEEWSKDGTIVAIACLEALALAEDRGIAKLIVVSDCLNVY
jgi:hypothetical protein